MKPDCWRGDTTTCLGNHDIRVSGCNEQRLMTRPERFRIWTIILGRFAIVGLKPRAQGEGGFHRLDLIPERQPARRNFEKCFMWEVLSFQ